MLVWAGSCVTTMPPAASGRVRLLTRCRVLQVHQLLVLSVRVLFNRIYAKVMFYLNVNLLCVWWSAVGHKNREAQV